MCQLLSVNHLFLLVNLNVTFDREEDFKQRKAIHIYVTAKAPFTL